jgi:hypothetical protein
VLRSFKALKKHCSVTVRAREVCGEGPKMASLEKRVDGPAS